MKTSPNTSPPLVLAIGGSDSSAGAGIQADLKSIHACGGYALTVITGVVAESPHEVLTWELVSKDTLLKQLECLFTAYPISHVKVGLLFSPELVQGVAEFLKDKEVVLVIDPVGAASVGRDFGGEELRNALSSQFFPLATLITPNVPEAKLLLGGGIESSCPAHLSEALGEMYQVPFLVKGGHSDEEKARDVLWTPETGCITYELERLKKTDIHGTGCSLASAICTFLAVGHDLDDTVKLAKDYLFRAMQHYLVWEKEGYPEGTKALEHFHGNS